MKNNPSDFSNPRTATLYKTAESANIASDWDVIVIGSGMGGMASAAALSKYGYKVLLLEQHYIPGGFTQTFSRRDFTWDVGVHCMGEMGEKQMPGRLLRWLSNDTIKMASLGEIYETFHFPDDFSVRFPDSQKKFKAVLEEKFPDEHKAISQYFDLVWKVSRAAKPFFARRILPAWLDGLKDKISPNDKIWWRKTTQEVLDELTDNKKLKTILTAQWGYYGSTPSHSSFSVHALTARHFWNGGYYPVGGSASLAEKLLKVIQDAGGATLVRASVENIVIKKGKAVGVKLNDGLEFSAKKIISAAGAKVTAERLVSKEWRESTWGKSLAGLNQAPAHVCLYLGFEGDIEKAGATKSNQWFFETWSCEASAWEISEPHSEAPVLYMSFPSLKDPLHLPGEKNLHTGEVVTFVPWNDFAKWQDTRRGKRTADYRDYKKSIEERLLHQTQRHLPEVMKHCVFHELSTPLSTTFFTRAPFGSIYGLEATPERFLNPYLRTRTPIKNLFLSGGDVAMLGVTGAMIGGVLAAGTIEKRILKKLF